jgi:hypothetical protein
MPKELSYALAYAKACTKYFDNENLFLESYVVL